MSKKTKLILTIVGMAALVVPVVLLIVATSKTKEVPNVPSEERQIDTGNIQNKAGQIVPSPTPAVSSSPATSSAKPKESTNSSSTSQ